MKTFCWVVVLISSSVALLFLLFGVSSAKGAPQEASAAAISLAIAVIPYVFSRAIEKLAGNSPDVQSLKYLVFLDQGKRFEFREKFEDALESYKDALYHLENDYQNANDDTRYRMTTKANDLKLEMRGLEQKISNLKS